MKNKITAMDVYRVIMNLIMIGFTVKHFGFDVIAQLMIVGGCFKIINKKEDE